MPVKVDKMSINELSKKAMLRALRALAQVYGTTGVVELFEIAESDCLKFDVNGNLI